MKVRTNEDRCVGAGQCALLAPEIFDQRDDDGVVVLLAEEPAEEHRDSVREATFACPSQAIEVIEVEE